MLRKMVCVVPQVTFDFNWTPKYTGRRYNYFEIANACDFVFVMSYDEHSLTWADCIAGSNAPYTDTLTGKNPQNYHLLVILIP